MYEPLDIQYLSFSLNTFSSNVRRLNSNTTFFFKQSRWSLAGHLVDAVVNHDNVGLVVGRRAYSVLAFDCTPTLFYSIMATP